MSKTQISFIGIGLMGQEMAQRLLDGGYPLVVWNRSQEKTAPLKAKGAKVASNSYEAIQLSPICIVMVSSGDVVQQVLFQDNEKDDFKGKTVIQMSTIGPSENKKIGERVVKAGGRYAEMPVLGSVTVAKSGKLQLLCSCDESILAELNAPLSILGRIRHVSTHFGAASSLKLALNQMVISHINSLGFALSMVEASGNATDLFIDIVKNSMLHSPYYDFKYPLMKNHDYSNKMFTPSMGLKDIRLMIEHGAQLGIDTRVVQSYAEIAQKTIQLGYGEDDIGAFFEAYLPPSSIKTEEKKEQTKKQ